MMSMKRTGNDSARDDEIVADYPGNPDEVSFIFVYLRPRKIYFSHRKSGKL